MNEAAGMPPGKLSVGLTGGIGSGKSTVAEMFRECGAAVIDSDVISHRLTQPEGAAIPAIRNAFGSEHIDGNGALDRARMRQLVFADASAKRRLETILHPLIRDEMLAQARVATTPYLLLVVPLLLEAPGYAELVQRILVVDCPEQTQLERTMQRSGLNVNEVRAIMGQQLGRDERLRRADDVIRNEGDFEDLRLQVEHLHRQYLSMASGKI